MTRDVCPYCGLMVEDLNTHHCPRDPYALLPEPPPPRGALTGLFWGLVGMLGVGLLLCWALS